MAQAQIDPRTILAGSPLFGQLSDNERDAVLAYARTATFKAGAVIFQKGDEGVSMMAVLKGRIKISNVSLEGKEAVLNLIEPGQVFGEIALLDGKERTADATAIEPTEVLMIQRRDFVPLLERQPQIAVRLIEVLCDRLRRTTEMVEDNAFLAMAPRVAKGLLRLAERYGRKTDTGTRIDLKLSQRELGGLVGLARENVNRQLRAWRDDEVITVDGGYITITDEEALRDIAEDPF